MYVVVWVVLGYLYARRFVPFMKQACKKKKRDEEDSPDLESILSAVKEHNSLPKALQEAINATLRESYPDMPLIFPREGTVRAPPDRRSRAVRDYVDELTVGARHPSLRPLLTDVIAHLSDSKHEAPSFTSKLISSYGFPVDFDRDLARTKGEAGLTLTASDEDLDFVDDAIDFAGDIDLDSVFENSKKGGSMKGEMLQGWASLEWISWFLKQKRKSDILETLRSATSKSSEGMREHSEREDAVAFLIHQV